MASKSNIQKSSDKLKCSSIKDRHLYAVKCCLINKCIISDIFHSPDPRGSLFTPVRSCCLSGNSKGIVVPLAKPMFYEHYDQ